MVFNGDGDGQDLCTLADKQVKTDDTQYPLTEKATDANWGMRKIWAVIYRAYGGWLADDSNQTTLPEYTADLVQDQQFYALPETEDLHEVSWLESSGTWTKLKPITLADIKERGLAEHQFYATSGNPIYYRPVANGFKIYPAADTARSAALRIVIDRDLVPFTSQTTNTAPGFDQLFHESVALYMALQYAKINSLPVAGGVMRGGYKTGLLADWYEAVDDISQHYQAKYRQMFPAKIKKRPAAALQYT